MDNISEQRACIKFYFKIGKNATETFELIKLAFGDLVLSRCVTFDWFKRFKEGRIFIEDDHRPGRPSTSKTNDTITLVRDKIISDRRLTVREVTNEVGISIGTCHSILSDELGMKRVSAKLVPKLLTEEQMEHCIEVCLDLKNRVSNDPSFIKSIISSDETWVYGYDPETKYPLLKSKLISWKTKITLYKVLIRPVALYACGAWATTVTDENRLATFERKVLRKIFGSKRNALGDFELRTNREVEELYGKTNIIGVLKSSRLGWAGHVWRSGGLIGLATGWKPDTRRPRGRPRQRWKDRITKDASRLGVNDGKEIAQDRDKWRQVVAAAMDLNGP
ncbi:hypothetical protein QTP88_017159 [Uroleucon formosanum]